MFLRALEDIPGGTDITISYEQDIETLLMPKTPRLQHVRRSFGLTHLSCSCPACGPEGETSGRDDGVRVETAALLELITPLPLLDEDFELGIHTTHINLRHLQRLHRQYIENFVRLGARDHKLCHAHWLLYHFHSYIADQADSKETKSRCEQCDFPIHQLTHLEEAVVALQAAIAICMTCYGEEHHKVQELELEMSSLREKLAKVLSKHLHRFQSTTDSSRLR